ncbi:hypothetical protein WBG78_27300 [Chryseolinea sp. T2]|uniref:hypothetical protein n=1 Tax=Chryseolinea sp. T2 TaxID=3129255 RepID=UPI003076EE72
MVKIVFIALLIFPFIALGLGVSIADVDLSVHIHTAKFPSSFVKFIWLFFVVLNICYWLPEFVKSIKKRKGSSDQRPQ